jgi:hypothetical protein
LYGKYKWKKGPNRIAKKIEKNRVRWCGNRLHWTIQEQWNNIIFSDEMWC